MKNRHNPQSKTNKLIRSSSVTTKFSNTNRLENLDDFINEYKRITSEFITHLWELDTNNQEIPKLIPKDITSQVDTWLSARMVQASAKQASGIVRGTLTKQKKRLKQVEEFNKQKMFKKARKLQKFCDEAKITKPSLEHVWPELDSRFINVDLDNPTSFDGWITIGSIKKRGDKGNVSITIPFKKTVHFNKMMEKGNIKSGARISNDSVTFMFDIEKPKEKENGSTIGIDIGIKDVVTLSDNTKFKKDIHNHSLESIQKKLSRKEKGSKSFSKAQKHRTNYVKWYLNQIDLNGVKTVRMENIKDLRRNKKYSRYMSHWTYTEIVNKLQDLTLNTGVQLVKINPVYTSQRCSRCGWTCKANRNGKMFVCKACEYAGDADYNASVNISFDLPEISKEEQLLHKNRSGFYWNVVGWESTVPAVQEVG
jgi:transposase